MRKRYSNQFKAQVVHEILREEKTIAQIAAEHGIHSNQLSKWKSMALKGLPSLFSDENKKADMDKATHERELQELYAEIGKLTTQLAWLKKNLASNFPRDGRLALIERENQALDLKTQADLFGLSRSSLYYRPAPPSAEEVAIKHRIDEIYTKYPFYGSRRITVTLQKESVVINRKAVQRHMREMGIAGICPGPNLSKRSLEHRVYPYLLGGLNIGYPNHVWGVDITYVRLQGGWMYLVAILDWFSRYVVSWELDQTLEMPFVLNATQRALTGATPTIWNSDQGS